MRILKLAVALGVVSAGGTVLPALTSAVAFAAQIGRVDAAGAEVREGPGASFRVIERVPGGSRVAASNYPTAGYFKVKTASGLLGWVAADLLIFDASPAGGQAKPAQGGTRPRASRGGSARSRYVSVKLLGSGGLLGGSEVNAQLDANVMKMGMAFGAEATAWINEWLGVVVRGEYLFNSITLTDQSNRSFLISYSAIPLQGGLQAEWGRGTSFSFGGAILGGFAPKAGLTSTLTSGDNSVMALSTTAMAFTGKLDAAYNFGKHFSIFLEGGYRYLKSKQAVPTEMTTGGDLFTDDGTTAGDFVPVALDFSGLFGGGGLMFHF